MLVSVSKQCPESKVKYSLQSGIAPYLKIQLLNNFRVRPFCFITESRSKSSMTFIFSIGRLNRMKLLVPIVVLFFLAIANLICI